MGPLQLTVIIPTRHRWRILRRTLDALAAQSVSGFDVVVVIDGEDQPPPELTGVRVLQVPRGGPGAARNAGIRATDRPLVLFLGDDMVPTQNLVERHLAGHGEGARPELAVLGHVEWHPEVRSSRLLRWLDWSGAQFDFASINGSSAHWGHFVSCNVSLNRQFFLDAGGFDPAFEFDYEDLDLGYRLGRNGLDLRYDGEALVYHLHSYDWAGLERRYRSRARAEYLMAAKHDWFEPFFGKRVRGALQQPPVSGTWPLVAELPMPKRVRRAVRIRADRYYNRLLAPAYLDSWAGEHELDELRRYLGDAYDPSRLAGHARDVESEEEAAPDETTFYRTSEAYLYDLTVFAMSGTKLPYRQALQRVVRHGSRLLDYGCGIGSDGLRLMEAGYQVDFADFDNPSTKYLRWRLAQRRLDAAVFDIEQHVPGGYDAVFCFDVIEHVDDPFGFLERLETFARVVAVNFLEPLPDDTHVHKPLPVDSLVAHARDKGLIHYGRYHDRSHLVIYRTDGARISDRLRRTWQRFGPAAVAARRNGYGAGYAGRTP